MPADAAMPTFRVRALEARDGEALGRLRRACYARSASFTWHDLSTLDWSDTDAAAVVLGVETDDGTLVATYRATQRADKAAAEALMQYATDAVPPRFPALVGGRTATLPAFARLGLTAATRHVMVGHALRLGVASVLAVVYEGAPRVRSMARHGYELHPCPRHWDDEAELRAPALIISLPAARFAHCLATIAAESAAVLAACSVDEAGITAAFDADAMRWRAPPHDASMPRNPPQR